MEKYMDEKVVEVRRRKKQAAYNSIETGVYVNNILIEFEEVELFEGKMTIQLPKGLVPLDPEIAKIKYSSESRPKVILASPTDSVNFTFNHFDWPIKAEETIEAVRQFKYIIQKVHPANVFYEMQEEKLPETKLSWFDFKGYAIDGHTYNIVYVTPLEGKVMHGGFTCEYQDGMQWKAVLKLSMLSIVDKTIKEEDEFN